jgi:UDP-glucose 4-epimerase
VTGGLGYIGSHVVVSLLETGEYEPIIVDNCHNASPRVVEACAQIASATLG